VTKRRETGTATGAAQDTRGAAPLAASTSAPVTALPRGRHGLSRVGRARAIELAQRHTRFTDPLVRREQMGAVPTFPPLHTAGQPSLLPLSLAIGALPLVPLVPLVPAMTPLVRQGGLRDALLRRYDASVSPLWSRGPGAMAARRELSLARQRLARSRREPRAIAVDRSGGGGPLLSTVEFAWMDDARDDALYGGPGEDVDGADVGARSDQSSDSAPGGVGPGPGPLLLTLLAPPFAPAARPLTGVRSAADTVLSPLSAELTSAAPDDSATEAGDSPPGAWHQLLFGHRRWTPAFMAGGGLPLAVTRELPQERATSDEDAPAEDAEDRESDWPDRTGPYDGRRVGTTAGTTAAPVTMLPRLLELVASIQRKEETGGGTPGVQRRALAVQQIARSGGQTLDGTIRRAMERTLGVDLSGVRVHTDADAAGAASTLSAQAFTLGSSIYFAQGAFEPASPAGLALLGHELVHTVQQQGDVQRRALASPAGSPADDGFAEPPHLEDQALRTEATLLRLFTTTPPSLLAAHDEAAPSLLRAYDGTVSGPAAGMPHSYGPPEPGRPSPGESPSLLHRSILSHLPVEGRADTLAGADAVPRAVTRMPATAGNPTAEAMAYAPRDYAASSLDGASSATGRGGETPAGGGGIVERAAGLAVDVASFVRRAYAGPVIDVPVSVAALALPMALPMTARLDRVLPAVEVAPTSPTSPAGMVMGQAAGAIPVISADGPGLGDIIARRIMDMPRLLANSAAPGPAPYTTGTTTLARRFDRPVARVAEAPDGGPVRFAARNMGQPPGDMDLSRAEPTPSPSASMMRRVAGAVASTGLPDSLSISTPPEAAGAATSGVGAFVHRFSDDVARRSGAPSGAVTDAPAGVLVGAMDGLSGGLRRGAAETMSLVRRFTDAVLLAGAPGDSSGDGGLAPPFMRDSAPVSASGGYPDGGATAHAPAARMGGHLQRAVLHDGADGADGAAYTVAVRPERHGTVASMHRAMSGPTSPHPAHDYAAVPGGVVARGIGGALGALLPAIEARGAAMSNVDVASHGGTGATVGAVVRRLTSFFHADDPTATGPLARPGHPGDVVPPAAGSLSAGLVRRMGALPVDESSWATTASPNTVGAVARVGSGLDAMRTDHVGDGDGAKDTSPGALSRAFAAGSLSPGFDIGEARFAGRAPADAGGSGFIGMGMGRVDRASSAAHGRVAPSAPADGDDGSGRREESLADVLVRRATGAATTPGGTVQAAQGGAPLSYQGGIAAVRREIDVTPDNGGGGEQDRGEALTLTHGIHVVDGRAGQAGSAHDTIPVTFTASPDAAGPAMSNGSHGTTVTAPARSAATPAADPAGQADHALPDVERLVDQVLSRVKRQLVLDHERAGGFLPDLLR